MTRLLFDAGETVFHFLLTSNSRYLILTGNAKLWGCYPNCSSEFSASGEQSKYEKQSARNYFLLVVLGSALVFSKVGSWGLCSPLSMNVTQTHSCGVKRMQNEEDPQLLIREVCSQGKPSTYLRTSHAFILQHTHTQFLYTHSFTLAFTETPTNVNSCTQSMAANKTANRKRFFFSTSWSTCPLKKKQTCNIYSTTTALSKFE